MQDFKGEILKSTFAPIFDKKKQRKKLDNILKNDFHRNKI